MTPLKSEEPAIPFKRYIAREVYSILTEDLPDLTRERAA